MKIKVCGIRNRSNLSFLNDHDVDFVGFIFYDQSSRYFEQGDLSADDLENCVKGRVGVFVNDSLESIIDISNKYQLDYIQLHGDESPEFCKTLKNKGLRLLKVFSITDNLPADITEYEGIVDFFLFDTKGKQRGGNGVRFDWAVLNDYKGYTPFILSGGIGPEDVDRIKDLKHQNLYAVDVNSRFENSPGMKDEKLLKKFIQELKN